MNLLDEITATPLFFISKRFSYNMIRYYFFLLKGFSYVITVTHGSPRNNNHIKDQTLRDD